MNIDHDFPRLATEDAWRLPEDTLRQRYWTIVQDLGAYCGKAMFGHLTPKPPDRLSRAEIIDIVANNDYWFAPMNPLSVLLLRGTIYFYFAVVAQSSDSAWSDELRRYDLDLSCDHP
jgi:uncharacterized membrane protein YsdA (DUF1294 family)